MREIQNAVDVLRRIVGVTVRVEADGIAARECEAIINYEDALLDPLDGDRQRTTITLPPDALPWPPPNRITITECDANIKHRVVNLKSRRNDIICYCELDHAGRRFTGPFRA